MQTMQIMLTDIDSVKRFVTLTNKYQFPVELSNGKYKIDAKSIMGVLSLEKTQPAVLEINNIPSQQEQVDAFVEAVQEFVVK